jgi:integrase
MNSKEIEKAKPGDELWDDQVKGLHARVFEGRTSFYLYYRTKAGRQRKPKLGDFGVISLAAARDIAREKLGAVAKGGDPDADRGPSRTVNDLKEKFMSEHASKRKLKTQKMYRDAWKAADSLLSIPIGDVKPKDIAALHHQMRKTPFMANRTLAVLRKAFALAETPWAWRDRATNPVYGIEFYKEPERKRYPKPDEASKLFAALETYPDEFFVGFIWLLVFTGCRTSEILNATWDQVREDGLHLPDSKVGERTIALSQAAREAIARIPKIKGNPHLIPGTKPGAYMVGTPKKWNRLLIHAFVPEEKRANFKGHLPDLQMRDLRRYYASLGLSGGLTLEQVGQLLGHKQAQTTKRYAFLMTDAANLAAEMAAKQVALVRARKTKP